VAPQVALPFVEDEVKSDFGPPSLPVCSEMPISHLPPEQLRVGQPTPVGLLDASGNLLLARGGVIETAAHRQHLIDRGVYVDQQESEAYCLSMAGKLDAMLRQNELLGRIAQARPDAASIEAAQTARKPAKPSANLSDLQMHAGKLLREAPQPDFAARLRRLHDDLFGLVNGDADTALLLLIDATTSEVRQYSVTHAMLVAAVCELAARQLPGWPAEWREPLRFAALTMNMAMTALQDTLAQQATPPNPHQRAQIDSHAERAAQCLAAAGIDDTLWIDAVRHHHDAPPGALPSLAPAQQLARLIQRADIFAARLSPRERRCALSGAAAAQAAYLDELRQADEAGGAIIKATGIYPPGSYVRLASGEVAVVLRRGPRANEPLVASVLSRAGTPLGEPALRNTRVPSHAVTAGVAPRDVRLRLNMERLLRLL
jgi:hypothetical protein